MIWSSVESVLPPDPNPLAGYDSCNQVAFVSFVLQTGVFFGYFPSGHLRLLRELRAHSHSPLDLAIAHRALSPFPPGLLGFH